MTKLIRAASITARAIALILTLQFFAWAAQAQNPGPAKELLQWVAEARKAGLTEPQIQAKAALAGWQENMVNDALRETSAEAAPKADTAAAKPANSGTEPPSPPQTSPALTPEGAAKSPAAGPALTPESTPTGAAGDTGTPSIKPTDPAAPADSAAKTPAGTVSVPAAAPTSPAPSVVGSPKIPQDRGVPDDYQIGAGDALHIAVWHEPDATVPNVVVRPDGKISMPLLKEVSVIGLTPSQLEKKITQELTTYLTAPDVTVIVTAINSKKIYAIGAVKKEGPIPYTYQMSVLQALSEAGGLTDYAKRKKIYVLRTENGREFRLPFDYDAVLRGQHMELNIPMMAGDTIVVPH